MSPSPRFCPQPNVQLHLTHMIKNRIKIPAIFGLVLCGLIAATIGFAQPKITPAKAMLGFNIGDDYMMVNYTQATTLLKKWASESDRMKLVSIGTTEEGRPQYMAIISSPANIQKLDHWKDIRRRTDNRH